MTLQVLLSGFGQKPFIFILKRVTRILRIDYYFGGSPVFIPPAEQASIQHEVFKKFNLNWIGLLSGQTAGDGRTQSHGS
jgi:hypothetical protein